MTLSDIMRVPVEEWRGLTPQQIAAYYLNNPALTVTPSPWQPMPTAPTVWFDPNTITTGGPIAPTYIPTTITTSTFI